MGIHKTASCRYCADQVDVEWLARHEAKCKTATPAERADNKKHRTQARERYRASMRVPVEAPKRRKRGPYRKRELPSVWTNGNGRRLSATISIDFKSFREMLLQLAPMLSIDKVEVL